MELITQSEIMEQFLIIVDEMYEFMNSQEDDNIASETGAKLGGWLLEKGNDAGDNGNYAKAIAYFLHDHILAMRVSGVVSELSDISSDMLHDIIDGIIDACFKVKEKVSIH